MDKEKLREEDLILKRFWAKVSKTKNCWLWIGAKDSDGYGNWSHSKKNVKPHRFSYELHIEKIPKGLVIDHLCRVRNCVNPKHLRAVSNRTNLAAGIGFTSTNLKKTHCPKKHPYSGSNLYRYKNARMCKQCAIQRQREKRRALLKGSNKNTKE